MAVLSTVTKKQVPLRSVGLENMGAILSMSKSHCILWDFQESVYRIAAYVLGSKIENISI